MRLETKKRLFDAIEACEAIERRMTGLSLAAFLSNDTVRDAVLFRFLVIGEALNGVHRSDSAVAAVVTNLDQIVAVRHRVIHAYADIDDEILWDVISRLGPLRQQLAALLGERPDA